MKLNTFLLSTLLWLPTTIFAQNSITKVNELNLAKVEQDYCAALKNRSITGEKIIVAGTNYDQGIGVIAHSKAKIRVADAKLFTAKVGVCSSQIDYSDSALVKIPLTDGQTTIYDNSQGVKQFVGVAGTGGDVEKGSMVFKVLGDGKELYTSPVMRSGDEAIDVEVDINGVKTLELVTSDAGDGISGDHGAWISPEIQYYEITPAMIDIESAMQGEQIDPRIEAHLKSKMAQLKECSLPLPTPDYDWLIDNSKAKAQVYSQDQKDVILTNGLVTRVFRVTPNLATIDIINNITTQSLVRAVSSEGEVVINGKSYAVGGLNGQREYGYLEYGWVDSLWVDEGAFRVIDFEVGELEPFIDWNPTRWSLSTRDKISGKQVTFTLAAPQELGGVEIKVHYGIYDGLPTIVKWMEVINNSGSSVNIDTFKLEELAMAEPDSPVEGKLLEDFKLPNVLVQSDWGFRGMIERVSDATTHWREDARYTSQCNYPMKTPCLLEVSLPMGPDEQLANGATFTSFHNWITPLDGEDRERSGLYQRRFYRTVAPWTTENPIFMHCTSSDPKIVREAIDQCKDTGYEMVILSFGSGLNMEDESPENYKKFRDLRIYANSQGIELGGYSLLSSRWISDEVDVINPQTGKRGGMIFGSSPCLSSEWGYEYFRKIKKFYEQTGFTLFENDGSYPGNVCASTDHAHHKGLDDSQWQQRKQIDSLYRWMCSNGIYTNVPDFGYIMSGSTKVGIGYREVNWSLPRERQLVLGRQIIYDGLWERNPSMCWSFVPLTEYHGGGKAATLEPLKDHLKDYKAHMIQNYGSGVQACYRGHRLYDSPQTQEVVSDVIGWYKKYRDILNSDIIHLRRADGRNWDGILHVNPQLDVKGYAMLYNPTDKDITRTITLPLYYTGLSDKASVKIGDSKATQYKLARDYTIEVEVVIEKESYTTIEIK